ncbi:VOC family protein [Mycolicibacterium sp. CR10]|uniref:VOC family protein n=1 Tax=Mycolicibacterium sp. CR10 TaxID=2562314 RepID=UPI0010C12A19|nr:VOC family protein [Mycolicibacterium sp. CR10]
MFVKSLGYLGVASPDAKEWLEFGPEVLGMQASERDDGSVRLRMDDADHRIAVHQGDRNRMLYAGWDVGSEDALEAAGEALRARGIPFEVGNDEDRAARGVLGFLALSDPSGLRHELFYGQRIVPKSFHPGRPMSRFLTGSQGLGHVVLATPDLAQADRFLRDVLGFKKSDEIYTFIDLWFYHCNPRHHSIALTPMPGVRGLHHVMVEVADFDDVGIAYDLCMSRNIPLSMTLGRHVNDRMVSFYVRTPSGFDLEYGWGGATVDDETWTVAQYEAPSVWGHQMVAQTPPGALEAATP